MAGGVGQIVVKRTTDRLGAVAMGLLVSVVDGLIYLSLFLPDGARFGALGRAQFGREFEQRS